MKTLVIAVRALLIGMLVIGLPSLPSATTRASGFAAPTLSPITATFFKPVTTYVENAVPAAGDTLTYVWSKDLQRNCGVFGQSPASPNEATWSHPDASLGGNCPNENAHPGVITLVVSDMQWVCTVTYPLGSAPGIGPPPAPCVEPAAPAPTSSSTPIITATPTITGTPTVTGTPTPTAVPASSPTASVTATPRPVCRPRLDVLFTAKAADSADPGLISISYTFKGSGFFPGGSIIVTLENGTTLTTAGDASGSWIAMHSATLDQYPPGLRSVKIVQGDSSSDDYCFMNAIFDTDTAAVQQLIQAGKDRLKKTYANDAHDVTQAGNTAKAVADAAGSASAGFGLFAAISGWVSDEEAGWAADLPDMAIYQAADLTPQFHALAADGLPPKLAAALNALDANLAGRAMALSNASTSINRASTALRLRNTACEVMQYNTAVASAKQADAYAAARPQLIKNLIAALQAAGIRFKPISVAAAEKALSAIRAHGVSPAVDKALRQTLGAKQAAIAEAATLAELRAEPLPTTPIDFLQVLNSEAAEKWYPAMPFAHFSPGFGVQANPKACKPQEK